MPVDYKLVLTRVRIAFGYFRDAISILVSFLYLVPTARYSERFEQEDSYEGLRNKEAVVVRAVSKNSGTVRYSGANWQARLAYGGGEELIDEDQTVLIIEAKLNMLIVEKK